MKKRQPYKYNKERVDKIVEIIASGQFACVAYGVVGISKKSFYSWKKKYPSFRRKLKEASSKREAELMGAIQRNTSWQAKAWALQRLHPKRYCEYNLLERKVEELQELLVKVLKEKEATNG